MTNTIARDIAIYMDLKQQLMAEFDLLGDDEALLTTLDGATNIKDRLIHLMRYAKEQEAFAGALKELIADMEVRKARFETRSQRLRAVVLWAMGEMGEKRLDAPDITATMSAGKRELIVTDEKSAIECYPRCRPPELDRRSLRELLETDEDRSYAHLGNARPSLRILTR